MKKLISSILIIFLISMLFPASLVTAQTPLNPEATTGAPGSWVSSINIQNPQNTSAAINLDFYDVNGTKVLSFPVTPDVPAGGSRSLYVPSDVSALANGQYSVVVSSSVEVNIVVNSSSSNPNTAGAYTGLQATETGTSLYYPGLYNNYYGFFSELVIQNAGSNPANISIQFYNQKTGVAVGSPYTSSIAVGSSKTFNLSTLAGLPSGNVNGLFSVKVSSNEPLAGIANIWTAAMNGEYAGYNAFVSGSTAAVVPALYKSYFNFVSSLTIQNISGSSANVTITYSNGNTVNATLSPNQAQEFYQPNNANLPSGNSAGVFSAKISSNQPIVALVNIENKVSGLLASYNGAVNATSQVLCPVVMKEYFGWFSAETIQNVGNSPTTITVTYANGQTREFANVLPNGTINVIELANTGSILPTRSSLAATITSNNQMPLVAVVQENSNDRYAQAPGDYLLAYTCTNK